MKISLLNHSQSWETKIRIYAGRLTQNRDVSDVSFLRDKGSAMIHWFKYYLSGKFIDLNISTDMTIPDMSAMQ